MSGCWAERVVAAVVGLKTGWVAMRKLGWEAAAEGEEPPSPPEMEEEPPPPQRKRICRSRHQR